MDYEAAMKHAIRGDDHHDEKQTDNAAAERAHERPPFTTSINSSASLRTGRINGSEDSRTSVATFFDARSNSFSARAWRGDSSITQK